MVSLMVMTILLGGLASALHIAGQALPGEDSPVMRTLTCSRVVNRLADELACATHFSERTANAVTFTVPDRDGDGFCERIRYAWDGSAKNFGPIMRTYNEGEPVKIASDVHEFNLDYQTKSLTETYPGPMIYSDEILLCYFDGSSTPKELMVEKDEWPGQYFNPSIPDSAHSWKINRVEFPVMMNDPPKEFAYVQIRTASEYRTPTDTILAQVELQESTLTEYFQWKSFTFDQFPPQPPGQDLCLVLKQLDGGPSCRIRYEYRPTGFLYKHKDDPWNYYSGTTMFYRIYGKIGYQSSQASVTRRYITGVNVACQVGSDSANRIVTEAYPLNETEVLNNFWKLDFDKNPTAVDVNGDGTGDWVRRDGYNFETSTLMGGVWQADGFLESQPGHDFIGIITAEVCCRDLMLSSSGAVFQINADWSGSSYAPLVAELVLQDTGHQKLTLYHYINGSTRGQLAAFESLPPGFVTFRLLIDPSLDTVNVCIDGQQQGTFIYNTIPASGDARFASLGSDETGVEFDYVSIRVGETGS
jgi:hypothetical protein